MHCNNRSSDTWLSIPIYAVLRAPAMKIVIMSLRRLSRTGCVCGYVHPTCRLVTLLGDPQVLGKVRQRHAAFWNEGTCSGRQGRLSRFLSKLCVRAVHTTTWICICDGRRYQATGVEMRASTSYHQLGLTGAMRPLDTCNPCSLRA